MLNRRHILHKKAAFFVIIGLLLFPFSLAVEMIGEDTSIAVSIAGGGVFLHEEDEFLHSIVGQSIIDYQEEEETVGLGLLWFSRAIVESSFSAPIQLFQIFIKNYDINWITINWTGGP